MQSGAWDSLGTQPRPWGRVGRQKRAPAIALLNSQKPQAGFNAVEDKAVAHKACSDQPGSCCRAEAVGEAEEQLSSHTGKGKSPALHDTEQALGFGVSKRDAC